MQNDGKLRKLVEKLIDFSNVDVQFKVEFKDNKKVYTIMESESGYRLEKKIGRNSIYILNLNSYEELRDQEELSIEDKEIFSKLFDRLSNNQVDKISIGGLKSRNPILTASIGQSIIANVSKQISAGDRIKLCNLWKERKEEFEEKFQDIVIDIIISQLKNKLESSDLPTPIFPTSVALSEISNYYIYEPKEVYTLETKLKLFNKLADSICGRCGQRLYGLYVPEEGFEIKEILKRYVSDFYNVDILRISSVLQGKKTNQELKRFRNQTGAFEYMFYLLDKVLQEMFRTEKIPVCHIELIMIEGIGSGKKFFSHYIIPGLNEIFIKLYHGNEKYTSYGISKIKALISSFLVENWNIDNNLKKNNSEIAHAYINRLLYFIFCYRKLDIDSILFLEDLKMKLGDTTPIGYLEEVISWM